MKLRIPKITPQKKHFLHKIENLFLQFFRYQYPVPVWADTNQRLTNAYPTIPQNYYQTPLRYPQQLNNYHYQVPQIPLKFPQNYYQAPQIVYYYYPQYPMVPQVPAQEVDQKQEDQSEQVDQDQKDQTELEQDQTELEQDQTELERQKRNADPYLPFSLNLGYPYHPATNVYHHPYPIKTRPKLNADSHLSIGLGGVHVGLGSPYHGYRAPAPYYYPNYYHHHHHGYVY